MVIAFKSKLSNQKSDGVLPQRQRQSAVFSAKTSVTRLPKQSQQLPLWLKLLVVAQQGSTALAGGLMAAALMVYSWTVYVDKMVFRTSRELEALKAETQQMTTTNETLKHTLAERAAQTGSGFRDYQPGQALFVVPAPVRPGADPSGTPAETATDLPRPLGY